MAFTHPENVIINQAAPFTGRLVDVQLSGASKAYVDQDGNVFINGNVGIGTASPGAKLHVVGNTYLMGGAVGINTTNPQERLDVRQTAPGGTVGVRIGGDGASAANFLDIAASDPSSNQMFWRLRPTNTGANQSRFDILNITQGQARISIDNAGNVGIGTETPAQQLHVVNNIRADGRVLLGDGTVATPALQFVNDPATGIFRAGANDLRLVTGGVARIVMDANGNVGIGTESPGAKLHVVGNVYLVGGAVGINTTSPQERLDVRQTGAGGTVGVRIGGDGASAASYLDIVASDAASNQMLWRLRPTNTGANQSRFDILNITQGQARISIDNAGNVGIGTQTPAAKLEVAGDVKASGNISSGASADIAVSAGRRLYFNGLGGTRYLADNSVQNCIDVAGNLAVGGGFGNTGASIDNNGTIQTNGNLQVRRDGTAGDPTLMYLGRAEDVQVVVNPPTFEPGPLNYIFWQNRFNREGWYWAGWNTFRHPNTVPPKIPPSQTPPPPSTRAIAWGYGYYPFRNWAKNHLIESSGAIVTKQYLVAPQIYFQNPQHIDLVDGQPRRPDKYDSFDHPFVWLPIQVPPVEPPGTALTQSILQTDLGPVTIFVNSTSGFNVDDEVFISDTTGPGNSLRGEINEIQSIDSATQMTLRRGSSAFTAASNGKVQRVRELGGVQHNTGDFGIKITREGNELAFYDSVVTNGKRIARLITGLVNNVKADSGETSGSFTIAANSRSADPLTTIT